MGNGVTKVSHCFAVSGGEISARHNHLSNIHYAESLHEGLGHSFCYIRPDNIQTTDETTTTTTAATTTFRSISGASISANTSTTTTSSTSFNDTWCSSNSSGLDRASTFESSESFASLPLQPVPRSSGILSANSGPIERGFLSGPIERGFLSGPIDRGSFFSGPVEREKEKENDTNTKSGFVSIDEVEVKVAKKQRSMTKTLKRMISKTISFSQKFIGAPIKGFKESIFMRKNGGNGKVKDEGGCSGGGGGDGGEDVESEFSMGSQNLQWAQGKAGEDRVHVVISEEHGWVFVGIYDGFNGPDAPDFLLSNLYTNVQKELKGLLWNSDKDDKLESTARKAGEKTEEMLLHLGDQENSALENYHNHHDLMRKHGKNLRFKSRSCASKRSEEKLNWNGSMNTDGVINFDVLKALSQALRTTEEAYFENADKKAMDNPELALMGSCVLVMLMKGEDVYLMNVGDSRAVLAQNPGTRKGLIQDLEIIKEENMSAAKQGFDSDEFYRLRNLNSVQLTMDHSTYVDKEVQRIKKEHPDDVLAIMNDRVKGYLKVTRAFGVGFLKQPKWNELLLEMFRIDYIGTSPYITCIPSLYHHRLSPRDRFLILSSDGLYQYFTNEEAVYEVGSFIATFPEGDPAQHLIEEVLFRAAKNAGLDFHELLEIPQGERRRYHDDVSVMIISLEGRIWRSSV